MKKLLMTLLIAAFAGIGSVHASTDNATATNQSVIGYESQTVSLSTAVENGTTVIIRKERIRRLERIFKRKNKWRKGRRIWKREKRKLRRITKKVWKA